MPQQLETEPPKHKYPSRDNVKYVGLSTELYEALDAYAKSEDRSASWMARKAVREFLDRLGKPTKK